MLKKPLRAGDDFLQDVQHAPPAPFHVWWLGQSGFLVQWEGRHLLFDPYLSDSLTNKYVGTEKPHVRITERVIAPGHLDFIDVVTSTHNHTDHLDAETLKPLLQSNPDLTLIIPEANRAFVAERLGIQPAMPVGLDAGDSVEAAGFTLTAVPAAHEELERDEKGRHRLLGYIAEFGTDSNSSATSNASAHTGTRNRWTVYHSGDTVRYDGMVEKLAPFDIDVAILPINGRDPARGVPGNLNGPEAAQLAREIGARVVIPCHFDMFAFNTVSPDAFVEACERLNQPYALLQNGERWTCERN